MREIKFKAWDKTTNDWYEDENQHLVIGLDGEITNCWNGELMDSYNDIICLIQYTGLKDTNGIEIYEGDIISFTIQTFYDGIYVEKDIIRPVIYENGMFAIWGMSLHRISKEDEMKVIGNIYENPNLLEVTK